MPQAKIRVGIVDDHQIVIDGLHSLLATFDGIECVVTSNSGSEIIRSVDGGMVDVLLLDIEMPHMDGIDTCRELKRRHPGIRVIALTMLSERSLIKRMIEAGADGYLLKNVDADELKTAILRVAKGKAHYSPEIAEIIIKGNQPGPAVHAQVLPSLSSREKEIVRLILDELTTAEIADKLNISFNTVETHRRNIMHKLNAKNTAGIVRTVMEHRLLE